MLFIQVFNSEIFIGWLFFGLLTILFKTYLNKNYIFSALINSFFYFFIFYYAKNNSFEIQKFNYLFAGLAGCYLTIRLATKIDIFKIISILFPLFTLVFLKKYSPIEIFGVSYITFRLSYAAYEIHFRNASLPTFFEYFGYAFFPITANMGPITSWEEYSNSYNLKPQINFQYLFRFFHGAMKYFYFSTLFSKLSFHHILLHHLQLDIWEIAIACIFAHITLYLKFSGFIDMMISFALIIGISLKENFKSPLFSTNIAEYWRRWHMSLTDYMRNIIFYPLQIFLFRKFHSRFPLFLTLLSIIISFILLGLWHGIAWNFFYFGLFHATGICLQHIWTAIKRGLNITTIDSNRLYIFISWLVTFLFCSLGMLLFSNSITEIKHYFINAKIFF